MNLLNHFSVFFFHHLNLILNLKSYLTNKISILLFEFLKFFKKEDSYLKEKSTTKTLKKLTKQKFRKSRKILWNFDSFSKEKKKKEKKKENLSKSFIIKFQISKKQLQNLKFKYQSKIIRIVIGIGMEVKKWRKANFTFLLSAMFFFLLFFVCYSNQSELRISQFQEKKFWFSKSSLIALNNYKISY